MLRPIAEMKRHATRVIAEVRVHRRPVFITERGQSAAVLLDVKTYEGLLRRMTVLEGIARGERAFADGRVVAHREARKRLSRWLVGRG
jgi:prevent-host-death family protein